VRLGLVDQLVEGDLLAGATAFARKVAAKPTCETRERSDKLGNSVENGDIFASGAKMLGRSNVV
jgi:enoyl-CoA hydratase/carnithine racemase